MSTTLIQQLVEEGRISRTFRRLDPERRQAVIDAIVAEAAERGPDRIRVKSIAQRACVSVGSLYQYFGNRQGLLDFAIEACVRTLNDLFEQSRSYFVALSLKDALSSHLSYGIEWSKTQAGFVRFFGRAAYGGDAALARSLVRPVASMMQSVVGELFQSARSRGDIRKDVDLDAAVRAVNVLFIAIGDAALFPHLNGYFRVTGKSMKIQRVVAAAVDMVMRGLGAE